MIATVSVRNQGTTPADLSQVSLYLGSSSGALLTSAVFLGTAAVDELAPGAAQQLSLPFTVPSLLPSSYAVIAVADSGAALAESSESNNRRTTTLRVTLTDLTVSQLTLAPWLARAGSAVTATVVVRNGGRIHAKASTVQLYFESGAGTPASVLGSTSVDPLAAGESRELSLPFTVPSVAPGRSYYVWAQPDPDESLLETNEGNNRRGVWLRVDVPDLAVSGLSVAPTPTRAGDPITVTLRCPQPRIDARRSDPD